jgi:hypothetical protein
MSFLLYYSYKNSKIIRNRSLSSSRSSRLGVKGEHTWTSIPSALSALILRLEIESDSLWEYAQYALPSPHYKTGQHSISHFPYRRIDQPALLGSWSTGYLGGGIGGGGGTSRLTFPILDSLSAKALIRIRRLRS